MAQLFHNLKDRVSAFNMHVNAQPSAVDQECLYKQNFILQVMLYWLFRGETLFTKSVTGSLCTSTDELVLHLCFKNLSRFCYCR